jgi:hypothetical protein
MGLLSPSGRRDRLETPVASSAAAADRALDFSPPSPVRVAAWQPEVGREQALRRFQAFAAEAGLSNDERAAAQGALRAAGDSWTAAVAYFEALEEPERQPAGAIGLLEPSHAAAVEQLVAAAATANLTRALGPERGALAERRLRPLGAFVALASEAR